MTCDSQGGVISLVNLLVGEGHQAFGIITGPQDSFVSRQRIAGAQRGLREHGLEATVVCGEFDYASGHEGFLTLREQCGNALDAVVCVNDAMAIGAIGAARKSFGGRVPASLAIVGFDGTEPARWSAYSLTTIRQPVERMAEAAVTILLDHIDDPTLPCEVRTFSGTLVHGAK